MSDQTYEFVGKFVDDNMPDHTRTGSWEEVSDAASDFLRQFGPAIKSIWLVFPDGSKRVYNGQGKYQFTVPSLTPQGA